MTQGQRTLWRLAPLLPVVLMARMAQAQPDHALYLSGEGATARLRGDTMALPAAAARCANCHEPSGARSAADTTFGPRLDASLAQTLPRRGGPPSAYGPAALCTLLRSGVDPAGILLRRAMPTYDIDEAKCHALWQVLSQREPLPQAAP